MRLLLVEDNVPFAEELLRRLRREGYAPDWLVDGRDAAHAPMGEEYDIAILDLGLPGRPGLDILTQWRTQGYTLPVLILTARNNWTDRIAGLEAGADDYLGKPFHPDELILRLRRLVRRAHGADPSSDIRVNGIVLDESRQQAQVGDKTIELTAGEFSLLRYFMLHPGKLLTKSRLADHLYNLEEERNSNVIEVYISRLRDKLGRDAIETRRGQGYIFQGLML